MVNGNKSRDVDINYISNTPNRLINAKTDNYLHLLGSMNNSILDSDYTLVLAFAVIRYLRNAHFELDQNK